MNDEKSLKQWLLDLFQKLFDLFKGREDNYADDNELLAGMAENDDEKAAIMQICDEIDETNIALDEFVEAAKEGKDPAECLSNELNTMSAEQGQPISDEEIKTAHEKEAEGMAEMIGEQMTDDNAKNEEEMK